MAAYYSLWGIAPPAPGETTAQIVKLDEDSDNAALLARAKARLEVRYGWCDELRADGPWLAHPRSPRGRCGQADLVLVAIHEQEPPPAPSAALYQPRLMRAELLTLAGKSRWLPRGLLVVMAVALLIKALQ